VVSRSSFSTLYYSGNGYEVPRRRKFCYRHAREIFCGYSQVGLAHLVRIIRERTSTWVLAWSLITTASETGKIYLKAVLVHLIHFLHSSYTPYYYSTVQTPIQTMEMPDRRPRLYVLRTFWGSKQTATYGIVSSCKHTNLSPQFHTRTKVLAPAQRKYYYTYSSDTLTHFWFPVPHILSLWSRAGNHPANASLSTQATKIYKAEQKKPSDSSESYIALKNDSGAFIGGVHAHEPDAPNDSNEYEVLSISREVGIATQRCGPLEGSDTEHPKRNLLSNYAQGF